MRSLHRKFLSQDLFIRYAQRPTPIPQPYASLSAFFSPTHHPIRHHTAFCRHTTTTTTKTKTTTTIISPSFRHLFHAGHARNTETTDNTSSTSIPGTKMTGAGQDEDGTPRKRNIPYPLAPPLPKRITIRDVQRFKDSGRPIVMITAYDYPSAVQADLAGIDIILIGDSVGMVELGHDTTQSVTVQDIIHHTRAVRRGSKIALHISDLPFGSYEISPELALSTAFHIVKETGVDAVKLEGGQGAASQTVRRIVDAGIAVMGHVGLMPAKVSAIGGFRSFGKTVKEAKVIFDDARAIQDAGAFATVLECVPHEVAREVTKALEIPTIGIGAGPGTSGQVLVFHDMIGSLQHAQHAKVTPKFCKKYASVGLEIQNALENYRDDVLEKKFPGTKYTPYSMAEEDYSEFLDYVSKRNFQASEDLLKRPSSSSSRQTKSVGVDENITVY